MTKKNYLKEHKFTALEVMQDAPVVPVIVVEEVAHAVPMAKALLRGGIRMLEVTLRTPKALDVIKAISQEVSEVVVGAGTVRNAKQAQLALSAGARFAVSPGLTLELANACRDLGLALLPGVATPTEIMLAQEQGFTELKFFPAVPAGGVKMLQAFAGPFPDVKFCPTGGVSLDKAREFLGLKNVACIGGSWLVPQGALEEKNWDLITRLASEATSLKVV